MAKTNTSPLGQENIDLNNKYKDNIDVNDLEKPLFLKHMRCILGKLNLNKNHTVLLFIYTYQ